VNAKRTISLAAFLILGLAEGRCSPGEAGAPSPAKALDLSKCHLKDAPRRGAEPDPVGQDEDLRKRVSSEMTRKEIATGEARAAEYLKRAKEGK